MMKIVAESSVLTSLLVTKNFTSSLWKVRSTWKISKYLTLKPESSQNGIFHEETGGRKLSIQNGSFPFKTGELEHIHSYIWNLVIRFFRNILNSTSHEEQKTRNYISRI